MKHYLITIMRTVYVNYAINLKYISENCLKCVLHLEQTYII